MTGTPENHETEKPNAGRCIICDHRFEGEACRHTCSQCHYDMCDRCSFTCMCGRVVCADCVETCRECGRDMCPNCTWQCQQCDNVLCEDDVRYCEHCDNVFCTDCLQTCDDCEYRYCDECLGNHGCDTCEPDYKNPYEGNPRVREPFTFGLEIEIDGPHDRNMIKQHPLIAGWCSDGSLHLDGSMEYQTEPMTMRQLPQIVRLVAAIRPDSRNDNAGGHMHVSRTSRQCASRWFWALDALTSQQAVALNMRHTTNDRWCRLEHGHYTGKDTAINDTHYRTIEFRTFGPWWRETADKLKPAVTYMHTMWRFFQHYPLGTLQVETIQTMSRATARTAIDTDNPVRTARLARMTELGMEAPACA